MFGRLFGLNGLPSRAEMARRLHSEWLTRALRAGGGGGGRTPRIPTRLVSKGGYGPLMATREGQEWAEQWWAEVLGEAEPE